MLDDPQFIAVIKTRIKAARAAKGMRQIDMAEALGLELRNYQRLEGHSPHRAFNPRLLSLRQVARVLGITTAELIAEPTPEEFETISKS